MESTVSNQHEKDIKISVTLPSRGKTERLSKRKQIKNARRLVSAFLVEFTHPYFHSESLVENPFVRESGAELT